MKKIWIRACIFMLAVSTVFGGVLYFSPRLKTDLERRSQVTADEMNLKLSRYYSECLSTVPISAILERIGKADLGRHLSPFIETQIPSVVPTQVHVNRSLLPTSGETWNFDFERNVRLKSIKSPTLNLHLRGAYSISQKGTDGSDYYVKVALDEGGPANLGPEKLPLFQVSLGEDGKIERVFVMGQLKESSLQEHWENLGKDLISNYFILDKKTRLGSLESESKWMGDSLFEKTIFSYSSHPELKIDGSNHIAYFDENGMALVEGSEHLSMGGHGIFNQSQSYRMERASIAQGGLKFEKNGPVRSLEWGEEKRLFTGSTFSAGLRVPASRDFQSPKKGTQKKKLVPSHGIVASEGM